DVQEKPIARQEETPMPTAEQAAAQKQLDEQIAAVRKTLDTPTPELDRSQKDWEAKARGEQIELIAAQVARIALAPIKPPLDVFGKLPPGVAVALGVEPAKRSDQQKTALASHYRSIAPELQPARTKLAGLERKKSALVKTFPK